MDLALEEHGLVPGCLITYQRNKVTYMYLGYEVQDDPVVVHLKFLHGDQLKNRFVASIPEIKKFLSHYTIS